MCTTKPKGMHVTTFFSNVVFIAIVKKTPQYTIIELKKLKNCIPCLLYFKFKEYALLMSTERVHCGTLHNNTSTLWYSPQQLL